MRKNQSDNAPEKPVLKHCPLCVYYLDGRREANIDGGIIFFPEAGYRHYRWTTGNIYDKIGYVTTCTCEAGIVRQVGRKKKDDEHFVTTGFIHTDNVQAGDYGKVINRHFDRKQYTKEAQPKEVELNRVTYRDYSEASNNVPF